MTVMSDSHEGQQLFCASRTEAGIFRFAREKSLHAIGRGVTIAVGTRLSKIPYLLCSPQDATASDV